MKTAPHLPSFHLIQYQYQENVVCPIEIVQRSLYTESMEARKFLLESDYADPLNLWFQSMDASHLGDGYGLYCQELLDAHTTVIPASHCEHSVVLTNLECLT